MSPFSNLIVKFVLPKHSTISIESVENSKTYVDFANKYLHIHRITSSATQEEILKFIVVRKDD